MTERIQRLKEAVEKAHKCRATHEASTFIRDTFKANVAWEGTVETFLIEGHHMAKRCYAWCDDAAEETRYTTILEIPPVAGPRGAVQTALVAAARQARPK